PRADRPCVQSPTAHHGPSLARECGLSCSRFGLGRAKQLGVRLVVHGGNKRTAVTQDQNEGDLLLTTARKQSCRQPNRAESQGSGGTPAKGAANALDTFLRGKSQLSNGLGVDLDSLPGPCHHTRCQGYLTKGDVEVDIGEVPSMHLHPDGHSNLYLTQSVQAYVEIWLSAMRPTP